jgi:hypothetical protein
LREIVIDSFFQIDGWENFLEEEMRSRVLLIITILLLLLLQGIGTAPAAKAAGVEDVSEDIHPGEAYGGGDEDTGPAPKINFTQPSDGGNVHGIVQFSWEVDFFDASEGYVTIEVRVESSPSRFTCSHN